MTDPCHKGQKGRLALVLAGGAARGAYEVGVVQHILEDVARDLGRDVPLDILCGTSVGAINVGALAAFADEPRARAGRLVQHWTELKVNEVLRPDGGEVLAMLRGAVGRKNKEGRRGGVFHPEGLERLLRRAIPWQRIDEHLAAGLLSGVTMSTTHVATGNTVVFVQRAAPGLGRWGSDPTVHPRAARLRIEHALASAAIPIMFPAVHIDGELFCDGGLRQNVPLSPARRLGATGLIVVNPHYLASAPPAPVAAANESAILDPLFLIGKALNALLLDRLDNDIERLHRINRILEAGCRRYGPGFLDEINEELGGAEGRSVRILRAVLIRSSQDIGLLAAEYVRSPRFLGRVSGVLGRLMRRLADNAIADADLLSYLLFDGEFARQLIELGRSDARARHGELCTLINALTS